jgi:hypothetical protein
MSRTIYVGDPAMISKIANRNWPKAPGQYEGFKPLSGSALFAQMDHQRWHVQRKALAPAFGPGVINGQVKSLNKYLKVSRPGMFLSYSKCETKLPVTAYIQDALGLIIFIS